MMWGARNRAVGGRKRGRRAVGVAVAAAAAVAAAVAVAVAAVPRCAKATVCEKRRWRRWLFLSMAQHRMRSLATGH